MKRTVLFLLILHVFYSCKKDKVDAVEANASYKIIFTTFWSAPAFTVPANVHITTITGMVHSKDSFLWSNSPATPGLEAVAEFGNPAKMMIELDAIIAKQKALSQFAITPPAINGTVEFQLDFTSRFSCISFASMIAPSPDWFTGINNYNLIQNNQWADDVSVDLFVYDAGSEDGDVFGYDNPETVPVQNVSKLMAANATVLANGNSSLARIATVRFIKN
ncbi:MAG: spondin domain-containing protein [Ferruginibacter sp.]